MKKLRLDKKRIIRLIAGAGAGALLGYVYYSLVGCNGGTCPITSSPLNTILLGVVAGTLIAW